MKLVHVTIQTSRFEEELAFYQEICGLSIVRDVRPARSMVFLADTPDASCIEIIENKAADDAGNAYLSVGFHCDDPAVKREELKNAGWEVSDMVTPNPYTRFFYVKDPAGVRVQFI